MNNGTKIVAGAQALHDELTNDHWIWNYTWRGVKLGILEEMHGVPRTDILAMMRDIAYKHDPPNADKLPKSRCDSCGMRILWGKLKGTAHPLDPKVLNIVTSLGEIQRGRESHFVSCPNANEHRRRNGENK